MKNLFQEFKTFALRGNVIDLAVGVIIGAAFGKITTSLVTNIFTPILSLLTGGVDFTNRIWTLRGPELNEVGDVVREGVVISYGLFIQSMIDFVIIAFAIFLFIKAINTMQRKEEEKPGPTTKPKDIELLEEIRDTLKAKN
ncbi:MAG: large conductance mechanosensitive channel protein MscL [Candidatus Zambryskibacteria bacterium CG10_big_fil_rev_8_21_14_0_10_42_12]|uniref:Large-conductance mechanosensitive channel n=1 Tax=Candidatus Zambryskibacteria bacterium CG10_big_fil_rev_8_21_14_0_10_42_12 TaxID=1975115 RepID=A0A2H0QWY4_9BACT|nr:MAG: large conductance mechanosensitive channel protein MscL [Candidatus Zambryskibacteria bacterium CG10_big_fil_rev_8_21_14_0_10_42_12]